ncbi:MAG: alpha/beta fold hydrolase [Lautropia sp.]
MTPTATQVLVPSGDVTLSVRRLGAGSGVPLLFLHGLSYFSYDWLPIAGTFGGTRECACMDMRGFGDSQSSPGADYAVSTMARDVAHVADRFGWERLVVVGHSMGGRSAAAFCAFNPTRAAGLVLVDYSPVNTPEGSGRVARTVSAVPDRFASVDDAMQYFSVDPHSPSGCDKRRRFEAYLRPVPGGFEIKRDPFFRDQFRRALQTGERPKLDLDMWKVLADLRCPTLVLRGTRSDMFAAETVPLVRSANPCILVHEIEAGHDIGGENPQGLISAVDSFLTSLEK